MDTHPARAVKLVSSIIACCLILAVAQMARAEAPYKVEGNKVDKATYEGWKIYKRQRCETCHGPTGEGGPAFPNLLNSMKNLSKEQFQQVVLEGRKNMPAYKGNKAVVDNIDGLYAYIKGRSDGAIPAGDLAEMQ
ncbi:Cbb3-type cytochrome c oxidase subunit III [Methylocaldum szegediense]|jgi:mono/diheme cytochrome c family protein|uniref:Cbb3-type cytochrome c oxidase subunit III n=2 Tax=Methylocaldum szegediense TaxID=73780 RepID=A0ABN8X9P7_9GAMM|nr:Cbb3-type cytochrome c oxidase subunit III [Methylocaldum szegediense]